MKPIGAIVSAMLPAFAARIVEPKPEAAPAPVALPARVVERPEPFKLRA
jgi:hypothetical protein